MARLNYHHLHAFWAVAREGHLTRAAQSLHVAQSALSTQIKTLEDQLGQALFTREGRSLQLTEAGRMALNYADTIFAAGNELTSLLRDGKRREREVLRIGAVATLSRNFQENFLAPLLQRDDVELVLQSAGLDDLLSRLEVHKLDVVLSNHRIHADEDHPWRCRRIARQPVSLVGKPRPRGAPFRFPDDVAAWPLLLPSRGSDIRSGFDSLCEQLGLRYQRESRGRRHGHAALVGARFGWGGAAAHRGGAGRAAQRAVGRVLRGARSARKLLRHHGAAALRAAAAQDLAQAAGRGRARCRPSRPGCRQNNAGDRVEGPASGQ